MFENVYYVVLKFRSQRFALTNLQIDSKMHIRQILELVYLYVGLGCLIPKNNTFDQYNTSVRNKIDSKALIVTKKHPFQVNVVFSSKEPEKKPRFSQKY